MEERIEAAAKALAAEVDSAYAGDGWERCEDQEAFRREARAATEAADAVTVPRGAVEVLLEQAAQRIRAGEPLGKPHAVACEEAAAILTSLRKLAFATRERSE